MIVVADTSPLNYLILIGHINVLPRMYGEVVIPPAVQAEMLDRDAPPPVQAWMGDPPQWIEVRTPGAIVLALDPDLDQGEREAITLVQAGGLGSVLLIDERLGRSEAARLGIRVTGTLGILEAAHTMRLIDLAAALERLRATNFKVSGAVFQQFIDLA